jgi:hypothetical protein
MVARDIDQTSQSNKTTKTMVIASHLSDENGEPDFTGFTPAKIPGWSDVI